MKSTKFLALLMVVALLGCKANPDDLKFDNNLLRGLKIAEEVNKPLFVHFTGFGSGGPNEFQDHLLTSQKILDKLNYEFVTIQLYVDDGTKLHKRDIKGLYQIEFSKEGKKRLRKMRNVGNLNTAFQIELTQSNTQPMYLILDKDMKVIGEPFGYMKNNKRSFLSKLNEGLRLYNESNKK